MTRQSALVWIMVLALLGSSQQITFAQADEPVDEAAETKTLSVAHIEIRGAYPEGPSSPGLLGSVSESLTDGINRLKKAGDDKTSTQSSCELVAWRWASAR